MIEVTREGRLLRVTLNRPEHRNLITPAMAQALRVALKEAELDEQVGAVLLDATGDFFCYGGEFVRFELHKPLITASKGAALGAGMALVAASHIAVASQGTSFGMLEIRNRVFPAGLAVIATAIGWRRATELALTGRVCSTPEALQIGLLSEVAPAFEYLERAEALAHLVAQADPETVQQILSARPPAGRRVPAAPSHPDPAP